MDNKNDGTERKLIIDVEEPVTIRQLDEEIKNKRHSPLNTNEPDGIKEEKN